MKLREGYKRIAIRVTERAVYVEFVRTLVSMESARKVVGVLFLFLWAFARTEMQVLR